MRLIVFFDLPMVTKTEKRAYVQFRRFLLNDGYDMIQWSVYARLLNVSARRTHLVFQTEVLGSQRCGSNSPIRLLG